MAPSGPTARAADELGIVPSLLVAVGGLLGSLGRWGLAQAWPAGPPREPAAWPWATWTVNLSGALLLGALTAVLRGPGAPPWARPLLGVGLLGGWTTFSAYAVEVERLVRGGRTTLAVVYGGGSVVAGLLLAALGLVVAGRLTASRP